MMNGSTTTTTSSSSKKRTSIGSTTVVTSRSSRSGSSRSGSSGSNSGSNANSTSSSILDAAARAIWTEPNKGVWAGRVVFVLVLASVAAVVGFLSYAILSQSEQTLTEAQFESIADRSGCSAIENTKRKRLGALSLASVIGSANPDPSAWPLVTLNNYETIASNLISTSKGCYMAFAPIVTPDKLQDFEEYIYDFYDNTRKPEPFSNGTSARSSFGKGVWSIDPDLNSTSSSDMRYHDVDGQTSWGSSTQILVPMVHHVTGPSKKLMMNFHSVPLLGRMIDDMLTCSQQDNTRTGQSLDSCAAISPLSPNKTSFVQQVASGPGSNMIQPVYASNDPQKLVGIVVTQIVWAEVMVGTFSDAVDGVDIVLTSGDQVFTYFVTNGHPELKGEGDLHDTTFDTFGVEFDLTPRDLFGPTSANYTITIYPTHAIYDVYSTRNPTIATIVTICIMIFTAIVFLTYDRFVRQEFNAKKDLLEAKRKFVRFVSHECRTPLNSVCMGLTLIKQEMEPYLETPAGTKKVQEWLNLSKDVAANADSAVDVLNDFLNYDKVESGKLNLEYTVVPIFQLIEKTVSEFKLAAAKKNIRLFVKYPTATDIEEGSRDKSFDERYVVGDMVRLTQVFRNLISNAIKFTPDQGQVVVTASWVPEMKKAKVTEFDLLKVGKVSVKSQGCFLLTVKDSGAGMTPDQIKHVFNQGTQFNVNDLQAGKGSGLGTYIAKGIVRQHEGSLVAYSEGLNKGSTFSLRLSVYDVPDDLIPTVRKDKETDHTENNSGPLKILVVDDAKTNLKLLTRLLAKEGHRVDGAEDGQEACSKVEEAIAAGSDFDVILMDYQMPVMDGPTAAKKMRAMGCDAFIVGVTGNLMPEDIRLFKDHGANAVLPKPISLVDLDGLFFEYGVKGGREDESSNDIAPNFSLVFDMN